MKNFDEDIAKRYSKAPDYPIYAKKVAEAIQNKECDKGILCCRSGHGMVVVAKVDGTVERFVGEEIIITDLPCEASSSISVYISLLAPMSIPLVGSSSISISGEVRSHLPRITFC